MLVATFLFTQLNSSALDTLWLSAEKNGLKGGAIVVSGDKTWSKSNTNAKKLVPLCSVTKLMTAQIIFQLIEEGKLSLASKIPDSQVTVSQLLTHTSGLPNMDLALGNGSDGVAKIYLTKDRELKSLDKVISLCLKSGPAKEPGSNYDYNNLDFLILQRLIQNIEKDSLANVLRRRIFSKAGMKSARLADFGALSKETLSDSPTSNMNLGIYGGAGSVLATLTDVTKWLVWSLKQKNSPINQGSQFGGFQGFGGYAYDTDVLGGTKSVFERPGAIGNYRWQITFLPKANTAVAAFSLADTTQIGSFFEKKGLVVDLAKSVVTHQNALTASLSR